MITLKPHELSLLYSSYVVYRDVECNGWGKLSIGEFYTKYGVSGYDNLLRGY